MTSVFGSDLAQLHALRRSERCNAKVCSTGRNEESVIRCENLISPETMTLAKPTIFSFCTTLCKWRVRWNCFHVPTEIDSIQ